MGTGPVPGGAAQERSLHAPSTGPHPAQHSVLPPTALRQLFGQYPTGVAIATTVDPQRGVIGMTINSFASLSLDPALVLWSIGERSLDLPAYRDAARFGISILSTAQVEVARHFADPSRRRSAAGIALLDGIDGVPLVTGAVVRLVCAVQQTMVTGDHLLIIGQVLQANTTPNDTLAFHRGRYARVQGY